jgi:hypothetical protein
VSISVSPISFAAGEVGGQMAGTAAQPWSQVMSSVSQLLGVSTDQLQSDLKSGQSLQSVASASGVSATQLVSTISQSLQSSNAGLSSAQANNIAVVMAQRTGHEHHGSGSSGAGGSGTGGGRSRSSSAGNGSTVTGPTNSGLSALLEGLGSSSSTSNTETNLVSELQTTGSPGTTNGTATTQSSIDTLL